MKLGYARVSTEDQNLDIQRGRHSQAGCEMMFEEKISGTARGRPELEKLMGHLRKDDVLVVACLVRNTERKLNEDTILGRITTY